MARNSLLLLLLLFLTDKYKLRGGSKMFQHIKASFDYEDYMVGKWPVELSGVTDTQVQWITRLLPADMVLNTVACVQTGGSCSSHQPEGPGLSKHLLARASLTCGNCAAPDCPEKPAAWVLWLCNVH